MSRPLRLEHAGALWLVTSRGNERRDVFRDERDREAYLEVLARVVDLYRWRLHAYVLLGNEVQLLVETPEPTLSRGMRQLNGVYTQAFNRRHGRAGHLFLGRYKAILVEKGPHLLELGRWVVLSPVRAGLARSAAEWRWSSYRAAAGRTRAPAWLDAGATLDRLGGRSRDAASRYRAFVAAGRRARYEPWSQVRGQVYLGSEEFLRQAGRKAERATKGGKARGVPRAQRLPHAPGAEELFEKARRVLGVPREELLSRTHLRARERALVAWGMRRWGLLTLREIGGVFGVGEQRASVMAREGEALAARQPRLAARLEAALGG